jgi:hypothetical protein
MLKCDLLPFVITNLDPNDRRLIPVALEALKNTLKNPKEYEKYAIPLSQTPVVDNLEKLVAEDQLVEEVVELVNGVLGNVAYVKPARRDGGKGEV